MAIFWQFLPSNAPIILYNIRYWWFFLSQGNRWSKYPTHLKIWRPKPCQLMFASLVASDSFYLLLSIQLTADLIPESNDRSMFHPLSHIYASKNCFLLHWNCCNQCSESSKRCCFWSTVSKCSIYFEHNFLIDKCSFKMVNRPPSDNFNSCAISRNFNLSYLSTFPLG